VVIEGLCASGWSRHPFSCLRLDEAESSFINILLTLDAVAVLPLRSGRISVVSHQRGIGWIVSESERTGQARGEG
jgi:hypothetical protein